MSEENLKDDEKKNPDKESSDDEKQSDEEKSSDKKSDVEESDDEKIFDDEKNSEPEEPEYFSPERPVTLQGKIFAYFDDLKMMLSEISLKYIISVVGGVLFFVVLIGAVLIFADPSEVPPENKIPRQIADEYMQDYIHIKISEGMSVGEIADKLSSKGVIASGLKFRILSKIRGYDDKLKSGTYVFTPNMTENAVFEKLLNGETYLITLTVPEGFGVKEIANRLEYLDLANKEEFLKLAENFAPYDYMKKRKDVVYSVEGFLFPATYSFEADATAEDILKAMTDEFDRRITPEMRERAKKEDLSIYDLTILASLVEREVRFEEDRAKVAQVFFKRLKINMPLQTDATLQYLLDAPKEDVEIEDTKIESPYNTYLNAGLPPGPIASPGIESFDAVLHPADTDYLYFVADRSGHNHYAKTYEEHMELVNQYR